MKTGLQRSRESLGGNPTQNKSEKNSCWKLSEKSDCCRSTGSVDRQRSDFRPLGRRSTGTVDRSPKQRVTLSVGRSVRSTEEKQRALHCSRSTGRSTDVHTCTVVHVGRPSRSTDRAIQLCQRSTVMSTGLGPKSIFPKAF